MKAKSISGQSTEEISEALMRAMTDGFVPTVAIVFISVKQDRDAVIGLLQQKNIEVFGASSSGEFINGHQSVGGIAILLLDIAQTHYRILLQEIRDGQVEKSMATMATKAHTTFSNPCLIICSTSFTRDGEWLEGEPLVNALERSFGADSLFFGGMAGDDWELKRSVVFANNEETDHGIAALVFDGDKMSLTGMAITGWKPMGIRRTITRSNGNLLYEIDGQPAVELYLKYLGKEGSQGATGFNIFMDLALEYPFITERGNNETMLITPRAIDAEKNALVMDMPVTDGTQFWFAQPPELDIVEEVLSKASGLKASNDEKADALLVFSCAGRQPVLGPLATEENEGLARIWDTPMAGFFTYGEYGKALGGKHNFHSGACCWVALKEKQKQ